MKQFLKLSHTEVRQTSDTVFILSSFLLSLKGQERYGNMTRVYYREAVGALVVFDMTRLSTFQAVLKWKGDLDSKVNTMKGGRRTWAASEGQREGRKEKFTSVVYFLVPSGRPRQREVRSSRSIGQQVWPAAAWLVPQAAQAGELLQGVRIRRLVRNLGQGKTWLSSLCVFFFL